MSEKAEYRNAIRSRDLIRKAFLELLHEKGFDHITVTDIVSRANINRGTFYAHYRDAMAVLDQVENEVVVQMEKLIEECNEKDLVKNPLPVLLEMGRFLKDDFEYYRLLIMSSESGSFLRKIRSAFMKKMMDDPRAKARYRNRDKFYINLTFFAGGMTAVYEDWFVGKINRPYEEIAALVCEHNPYRGTT
jgi:AcrR family transcriptional regulator